MPSFNFEVKSYQIQVGKRWDASAAGSPIFGPAYIACTLDQGWTLVVYFLAPNSPQAANTVHLPNKRVTIFAPPEHYHMFVDVLRNEKPVFAKFNSDKPEWNAITTGAEPVGEHDVITI